MSESLILRSFSGGELAPAFAGRADIPKYTIGAKTIRNFIVQKQGGVANRPGFGFIEACKTNTVGAFLFRFLADDPSESILIEAGNGYLRFYKDGAQVNIAAPTAWSAATAYVAGDLVSRLGVNYYCILAHTNQQPPNATYWYALTGTIYEIPTPFTTGFRWNQSGPIVTLTHQSVAPYELIYLSLTRWVLQVVVIAPNSPAPTNVVVTAADTPGPQADQWRYAITSAAPGTFEESLKGQSARFNANPPTAGGPNIVQWDAMTVGGVAVPEYYVFRDSTKSEALEFIATARTNLFLDTGFQQDPALTPPINDIDLTSANNRPSVSAFHQQRRFFANTITTPDALWGSRTGQRSNFCRSSPLQDDDSLAIRIVQNQNHAIRALVSVAGGLIVFTAGGEHRILSGDGSVGPLTPNSLDARQDLYVGAAAIQPVVVGNAAIYVQARGKILRDVQFDQAVEGLAGRDLMLLAGHLTEGFTIAALDYQQNDNSVVWLARSDGALLGLTYIREQDVWGWHRHDTATAAGQSVIESLVVVPEDDEDVVYALVARVLSSGTVRYIERLSSRVILNWDTDSVFLDSSLSRTSGAPISTLTGLDHLEGETIGIVADGAYLGTFVVASGSVALGGSYSVIHAGLRYECDLETLDLDLAGSDVRDKKKRVGGLSLLVQASNRSFQAGINEDTLAPYTPGEQDSPNEDAFTGLVNLSLITQFGDDGRVFLRHTTPLPLNVLAVIPRIELGG